jgi:hypothetical protein
MWDPRGGSCDSQVKAAIDAARTWETHVSIGLIALWVGWPGGLALYACGRAMRVMRRDDLSLLAVTPARGTRSRGGS